MSLIIGAFSGLVLYAMGLDTVGIALIAANVAIMALICIIDWKGTKDEWKRMRGRDA